MNLGKISVNENLKENIPDTDYDRSKTTREYPMFEFFG
jgi:hypothetical protein